MSAPARRPTMTAFHILIACFVVAAVASISCSEVALAPNEERREAKGSEAIRSSAGMLVSRAEMDANLREVTRAVALAMGDATVRSAIYRALRDSPYPENKLDLRAAIQSDALRLLPTAASAVNITEDSLQALLDRILPLEMYLPIDEHRARWSGDDDLIVISILDDDGSQPHGFDLLGKAVPLNAHAAPQQTALALLPMETDFTKPPRAESDQSAQTFMTLNGVVMTSLAINDSYEFVGNPEFEVHAFIKDASGDWMDTGCAGEQRSSPFHFNYDDPPLPWDGEVLLIAMEDVADRDVLFTVWEDDDAPCGHPEGMPPKTNVELYGQLEELSLPANRNDDTIWERILKAIGEAIITALTGGADDFVGIIAWPPVNCWPEATGPVYASITGLNGQEVGYARLDNTFDTRSPICQLSTTISGPSTVEMCPMWEISNPEAMYVAGISGGTGTETAKWWLNDVVVETDNTIYTIPRSELTYGTHRLDVLATKGAEQAGDWHVLEVVPGAECGSR